LETDERLYERARDGDLSAFDQLYARHERRLFGFILRLLGNRAEAEDVFHDVFLGVMTGPTARFDQAHFVSYLFRVARNACANRRRGQVRSERALGRLALEQEPSTREEEVNDEESATALARAAEGLPSALADVFALRASGLSYGEIADALDIPLGTVKSRMNAVVTNLKEVLKR
jgi:RNA polymerase sigma factor (sigma-70 family)